VIVILALLMLEQVSLTQPNMLSRADEHARLGHIPQAPATCGSFFANDEETQPWYTVQIDAMMVAITQGLPTLNGYSGFMPPTWDLHDAKSPDYVSAATKWASERNILASLCRLDIRSGNWAAATTNPKF